MSEDSTWDALEAASASVDRLLAADLSGVEDVMPAAEVAEELARKVAAAQQKLAAEVVAREGAEAGVPSPKQLLQARLRLSPREAKSRVGRAADLAPRRALTGVPLPPRLPATAAAQAEGALSVEQVQVIQHTMKLLPAAVDPGTWAAAEAELAGHARQFDPKRLGILATRLRACLDPDGTLATELEQVERRELSFARDVDGSYFLRGRLDPEGAEVVRVALDSLAAPRPAEDGTRDPRTPGRRQADALVELAQRAINGGELPDSGGRPTQLLLLANLADLQAQTGLAELSHTGNPISIHAALRMACDAELIPAVFGDGQVLTAGRTRRLATKRQRDALIARDRGCAAPDCDARTRATPKPITSCTGPTAARQTSTISCSCADDTTEPSTPNTGPSPPQPTANPKSDHHPPPAPHRGRQGRHSWLRSACRWTVTRLRLSTARLT